MEFDLEYKLQQFREAQSGYYDKNGKRYSSTPINTGNAELMLEIINELESALANAETELRQLTIPVVSGSYVAFCDGADDGVEGLVQLSNTFDNVLAGKRYCESFKSKSPVLYKLVE